MSIRAWTRQLRDKALALLPDAKSWAQCTKGLDARCGFVSARSPHCVRRSIIGVIERVANPASRGALRSVTYCLLSEMEEHLDTESLGKWACNHYDFADVRRAFETIPIAEDDAP